MWKAPNRPASEITQSFNDGCVIICSVENISPPGYKPKEGLKPKFSLRYEEQRLGINRLYLSRQNQAEIERVLRIPRAGKITSQDIAVTEDENQYRIDSVQNVPDIWPSSLDISLTAVKQKFEAAVS